MLLPILLAVIALDLCPHDLSAMSLDRARTLSKRSSERPAMEEVPPAMGCYRVVHVSKHKASCVYVGRACRGKRGHPLRNTEKLPRDATDGERAACIARYRERLLAMPDLTEQLDALRVATNNGELPLACWCAPRQCHADVLISLLRPRNDK